LVLEVKEPRPLWEILFPTHHTDIVLLYIVFSLTALMLGGIGAMMIRTELFFPGPQLIPDPGMFHSILT
jgi:cytochrome c oxidase subunit I